MSFLRLSSLVEIDLLELLSCSADVWSLVLAMGSCSVAKVLGHCRAFIEGFAMRE